MPQQTVPGAAPVLTLAHIRAMLAAHRADLAARYHLTDVGVFGAYARGEQQPTSDLDLLVGFAITPSLFTLVALEDELSDLLGIPVDVAVTSALRSHRRARIVREVVPL